MVELGVRHVFVLPGGGCMYLVDALYRNKNLTPITLIHEQSLGIAAEAYAQYENNLSVVLVTTGPGVTNAITPCAAAWTDSTPMLFISGQVKTSDSSANTKLRQSGFQEVNTEAIVKSITKDVTRVTEIGQGISELHRLSHLAINDRPGPVWLDIPLDLQNSEIKGISNKNIVIPEFIKSSNRNDSVENVCDYLLTKLSQSKRPIILAGNGIRLSNQINNFKKFIEKFNIPTLLSWKAIDFFDENHQLNFGRPGTVAQPWANLAIQNCDLFISFGARLDKGQIAYRFDSFARGAQKILVDIDSAELQKFPKEGITNLEIDLKFLMPKLVEYEPSNPKSYTDWILDLKKYKKDYNFEKIIESSSSEVSIYKLLDSISNELDSNSVLVPGSSGACSEITMQYFKIKEGQRALNSEGLGPMGFGIPAAIGVAIASGKKIVCIDGDGGFFMNVQELSYISANNLSIIFFVLNNNGYGSIRTTQSKLFEGRFLGIDSESGLYLPKLKEIAYGFGLEYLEINSNDQLENVIHQTLATENPKLVNVKISQDSKSFFKVDSYLDQHGKVNSFPMEDMSPPLKLKELQQLMKIDLMPESILRPRP